MSETNFFGKDVHELSLKDFKIINPGTNKVDVKFVNPHFAGKDGIVISYAPWCPHCHNMQNDVVELARVTKGLYPVGIINSDNTSDGNNVLLDAMNVTGYPNIKIVKNGTFKDYTGGRNLTEILRKMCMESGICEFL